MKVLHWHIFEFQNWTIPECFDILELNFHIKKLLSSKENDLMSDQVPSYNSKMGQHQEIYHFQFF